VRARPTRLGMAVGDVIRHGWEAASRLATIYSGGRRAKRFYSFGENSSVRFPWATILGDDRIAIGHDTMVGPYATLSAGLPLQPPNPAWAGPTLTIGDRCLLGRNATITAHLDVVIEDDVWTGNAVFISDQNHDWVDPARPIGEQSQAPRPVRIGAGSWIGNGAMILPGASIGRRAVVAAGAVVTGPVPDHVIVGGVPAKVIGSTRPGDDTEVVVPLPSDRPA
jgi:carbonic anhydrase/acetyltransferase-like protein (isoleucine patch superfamily)